MNTTHPLEGYAIHDQRLRSMTSHGSFNVHASYAELFSRRVIALQALEARFEESCSLQTLKNMHEKIQALNRYYVHLFVKTAVILISKLLRHST